MIKKALLAEILRLPPDERIALLGDAWDSIAASPADVPIPEWHVQELERRLEAPDPQFVPWEEVRSRLRGAG
ncbi:MAG: addiction module protein [Gemmatimonadota bacterium]